MSLITKYRPNTLDEVWGNEAVKTSLRSILERKTEKPHSYLFYGPSGCGKTTLGRIVAKELGCKEGDLYEQDMAKVRGIDGIRAIADSLAYSPMYGAVKVHILDEVHQATPEAQSALLKMLEEPPEHVYFILCTTEPETLKKTILTRCTKYQVHTIPNKLMKEKLNEVVRKEGVEDLSPVILNDIVRQSEGCPREALAMLDKVIDVLDEQTALDVTESVVTYEDRMKEICQAIVDNRTWDSIRGVVAELIKDKEPETMRYAILNYLMGVLMSSKRNDRISELINLFSENTFSSKKAGLVNMIYIATK